MKDCVIIIPAYKEHLSHDEKCSLNQVIKQLGDGFDISLVCPYSLDITEYSIAKIERFPDEFFISQASYAKFMTLPDVYDRFVKDYEYLLIYQLDAWVFGNSDDLRGWIKKGYDYIGAPYYNPAFTKSNGIVQNGGLCLRKIKPIINYINENDDESLDSRYWDDGFYSHNYKDLLKFAPFEETIRFSLDTFPREYLSLLPNPSLPFGCHAFKRFDWDFWKEYIHL